MIIPGFNISPTLLAALAILVAASTTLHAQYGPDTLDVRTSAISPLEYVATNTGIFGHDPLTRTAGLSYPRASGRKYLFGSGLWFGARKGGADRFPLVFYTYNVNTGRSEATPGEPGYAVETAAPWLYHSVEYNLSSGSYGRDTTPLPPWPLWQESVGQPATMYAPGAFEPSMPKRLANVAGRAPAFALNAEEQMFARYTDRDLDRYEIDSMQAATLGYPIGVLIEQNIYSWKLESPNQRVVVIGYAIINRSGDTLRDCIASQAAEPDIGDFNNDHVSFYNARPELRSGYFWSDRETDGDYQALAMTLVEAPVTGYDGLVDNSQRLRYRSEGRAGAFPRWTAREGYDPITHIERYRLMSEGGFAVDEGANDYRGLLSTTRFSMAPGDTAHFVVAFAIVGSIPDGTAQPDGSRSGYSAYSQELDYLVEGIMESYYSPPSTTGVDHPAGDAIIEAVTVMPNPARGLSAIEYSVAAAANVRIRVSNSIGTTVISAEQQLDHAGRYHKDLDISSLPSGIYFITVAAEGRVSTARLVVE
jgi:hypothetical protein